MAKLQAKRLAPRRLLPVSLLALSVAVAPGFALAQGTAAATAAPGAIKDITVSAKLDAFRAAPDQATVLPGLLKRALAARKGNRLKAQGAVKRGKIASEVLRKAPQERHQERAVLTGVGFVEKPSPAGKGATSVKTVYRLSVASAPPATAPAGTNVVVMTPNSHQYQNVLVNAVADAVVQHLGRRPAHPRRFPPPALLPFLLPSSSAGAAASPSAPALSPWPLGPAGTSRSKAQ